MTPTTPSAQQFDEVSPYAVFQPCDSPKYAGSYNKDFGYKGQVFSPKYKQSTQNLSKEARQVFNGAVGIGKHDKMNTRIFQMIIMKRLIIGIVVCLLIASCIVILPITSTVANRLGETDGILTCSVTKKQSSQTTSPVIWDKETFAAFYSLAQTVNATFHGADPHMEYPLEETSYTLYLEHPQGESDLLVLTEGNLLFYHGLRYTLDSNALFSFLKEHA